MNNARRKEIKATIQLLKELVKTTSVEFDNIKSEIESIQDKEQEALDNMPESMEGSERYSAIEEALENLQSALDVMDEADSAFSSATDEVISALGDASA